MENDRRQLGVKCRLIVPGLKDKFQDLDTYAGTTSSSCQRLVNAVAAENADFILFSFDVSQAFAKGLTFEELSKLTGIECRAVQFDVPRADLRCLKQLRGLEGFDPAKDTLTMLKPIYGLKDAPLAHGARNSTRSYRAGSSASNCTQNLNCTASIKPNQVQH